MDINSRSKKFAEALNSAEKQALEQWVNLGYIHIRNYQQTGAPCTGISLENATKLTNDFTTALEKAPKYNGTVYRGLAAYKNDVDCFKFLQELITKENLFCFTTHDSASMSENEGKEWAKKEGGKDLSILLIINSKTGRSLYPFKHKPSHLPEKEHKNEQEIVLPSCVKYICTSKKCIHDETGLNEGTKYWEIYLSELD